MLSILTIDFFQKFCSEMTSNFKKKKNIFRKIKTFRNN